MITPHVKALLLDAVGTTIHPIRPVAELYAEVGQRFGHALPIELIAQRFRLAFQQQAHLDDVCGRRTDARRERQRWQAIVAEVFEVPAEPSHLFEALWEAFAEPSAWRVYPDVVPALERCAALGLPVYLASNFDDRLHGLVRGLPELRRLAGCFVSSDLGWSKPAAAFFLAIRERLQLPLADLLMVGDHPEHDLAGARAVGLPAVLIDREGNSSLPNALRSLLPLFD